MVEFIPAHKKPIDEQTRARLLEGVVRSSPALRPPAGGEDAAGTETSAREVLARASDSARARPTRHTRNPRTNLSNL